jgi:hypothetical protein
VCGGVFLKTITPGLTFFGTKNSGHRCGNTKNGRMIDVGFISIV